MRSELRCFNGVFLSSLGMFSLNYGKTRALFLRKATFQARFPFINHKHAFTELHEISFAFKPLTRRLTFKVFTFTERIHSFVRSRISLKYDYIVAT